MAEYTQNYHLRKLGPGESISDESYKFSDEDRDLIDHLLHHLENHHHSGTASSSFGDPLDAPDLTLQTTGGVVPAGTRVFYKVALIDPDGFETAASPEAFVDTPTAVSPPGAPALELVDTGGALLPGAYYYVLTQYYPLNTQETTQGTPAYVTIPTGATNEVVIHFPLPDLAAAGFNIYRQRPGSSTYHYLASVPITSPGVTPGNYTDDNSVTEDPDRRPPSTNATQSSNSVVVDLPAAVDPLPEGWTWKVYRTYLANSWSSSLLHQVVEETFEGSGIITTEFIDTGIGAFRGQPLSSSQLRGTPPKVDLGDLADVSGRLPLGGVQAFPFVVTFAIVGQVMALTGKNVWVCEFVRAHIVGVRASLGLGFTPDAQPVIVDVKKGSGIDPTYSTIFTTSTKPQVGVGHQMGSRAVPDVVSLVQGDSLKIDIVQAGGGAGTDEDLTVNIVLLAQFDAATSDWSWS